ncbi:MAG: hypothetical protein ABFS19_00115 [Thermodesulfobacteriota bacterium]
MDSKKRYGGPGSRLTANRLKGKQSVRATFRLPPEMIELLSAAALQLGLKQKSLFDQLVEDRAVLEKLAREVEEDKGVEEERRQKTYVLSRNSLLSLNDVAKVYGLPRDVLVEISIRQLLPVLDAELEHHRRRQIVLEGLTGYLDHGRQLVSESGKMLGTEDRLVMKMSNLVNECRKLVDELEDEVERGRCLDQLANPQR